PPLCASSTSFLLLLRRLPRSSLFPYTTLFRSRQGVAVARAATWARTLVIMDEPTAALGVKETGQVIDLIKRVRERGLPVILISRSEEHTSELQSRGHLVCRLLLEKKNRQVNSP